MISNISYKKSGYEDDDNDDDNNEDDDDDGDNEIIQMNEKKEAITPTNNNAGIEKEEELKFEAKVENEIEVVNSGSSIDMSKILEEIRLIEQGMFYDSIDPVAKRYFKELYLINCIIFQ